MEEARLPEKGNETEDIVSEILRQFALPSVNPTQYSPLALAYIGDNIYELVNRTEMLYRGNKQAQKLHRDCSARANARTQAAAVLAILPMLTEEEEAVYRRGRNAAVYTKAKNASIVEYHEATGFEALIGYLFLSGQYSRAVELIREGFLQTGS
ncbi:MAG: ribonuclease III [Lachnospiraceae bacterium]|nr:ribonuclease III [Lachnospiraceae bacterium]